MQPFDAVRIPIPKPKTPDEILPHRSDEVLVASVLVSPFLAISLNQCQYLPAYGKLPITLGGAGLSFHVSSIQPQFPIGARLLYRMWWENVASYPIAGPQKFTRDITVEHGVSTEDASTFAYELGVELNVGKELTAKLSAKISSSVSHKVTVTDKDTLAEHFAVDVPDSFVYVYTGWQLIESFEIADANSRPLNWAGTASGVVDAGGLVVRLNAPATLARSLMTNRTRTCYLDLVKFKDNAALAATSPERIS
jgi:hypothetical protein